MTVLNNPEIITGIDIKKVEEHYNARYVCETTLKTKDGWRYQPSLIFYSETPHPEGSNYFALSYQDGDLLISNGISATEEPIVGIRATNGDIIYSRYRHDYRLSPDHSVFIDGGREYTRRSLGSVVNITIQDGNLVVSEIDTD